MQERVAASSESAGLSRRLAMLQDIVAKLESADAREDILNIVRMNAKWLITYDGAMVCLLNQAKSHYTVHSLSPVADASELNHKLFRVDEGMPGWVLKNHALVVEDIESGPVFRPSI